MSAGRLRPHAQPLLGGQRQQRRRFDRRMPFWVNCTHAWAELRNGRARNALHISQGGVGERLSTSVLGLEGLHQIIAVAQLAR